MKFVVGGFVIFKSKLKYVVSLTLLFVFFSQGNITANATVISKPCTTEKLNSKDIATLNLASVIAQMPSVEWGTRAGCFKKYGLTIKSTVISTSQLGIAGMVGGSYDLVMNTPNNLILAAGNAGLPIKIIAPRHVYNQQELLRAKREPLYPGELLLQTALLVSKSSAIKGWPDLSGKKIGIQGLNGSDHAGVLLAMKTMQAKSDKTQFITMATSQMEAALQRGDVDAVIASDPFATSIISSGGRVIGYPVAWYQEPGATVVYASLADIVAKKRDAFIAFKKAILEMNKLMNLPENSSSIKDVIAEVTGVSEKTLEKSALPTMGEKAVTFQDIGYLPNRLKSIGFLKARVNVAPMLKW